MACRSQWRAMTAGRGEQDNVGTVNVRCCLPPNRSAWSLYCTAQDCVMLRRSEGGIGANRPKYGDIGLGPPLDNTSCVLHKRRKDTHMCVRASTGVGGVTRTFAEVCSAETRHPSTSTASVEPAGRLTHAIQMATSHTHTTHTCQVEANSGGCADGNDKPVKYCSSAAAGFP